MAISLHDGRSTRRLSEGRSADWSLGVFHMAFFMGFYPSDCPYENGIGIFTYIFGLNFYDKCRYIFQFPFLGASRGS